MRTLVDIPDSDIRLLDELAAETKRSRAAEIRQAVRDHLQARSSKAWLLEGFGYWKDRDDIGDGVEYQRAMRDDHEPF